MFGNPIPAASLNTFTLTLVDTESGSIVNSVNRVNVLNTGRGTVDSQGNVQIYLGQVANALDTTLLVSTDVSEIRSAILDWTYNSGTQSGAVQIDFRIVPLSGP